MHPLTAPVNRIANKNFQAWMKILKKEQMIGFEYPATYTGHPSPEMKPHFDKIKGYLYLFKDKLRYGWQKKEYRSIYSYEQYWRRTC